MEDYSIIEALADGRLVSDFKKLKKTKTYGTLEKRLDAWVENLVKLAGEEKRPLVEQYRFLNNQQQDLYARDAYLRGFRLGALTALEVWENRDLLIHSNRSSFNLRKTAHPPLFTQWSKKKFCILEAHRAGFISTNPENNPLNKRDQKIDKQLEALMDEILENNEITIKGRLFLLNKLYIINSRQMYMKESCRFQYGYSTGMLLITELLSNRWKAVSELGN